eukprot:6064107-Pleurochrysis_carterae.AAC.1
MTCNRHSAVVYPKGCVGQLGCAKNRCPVDLCGCARGCEEEGSHWLLRVRLRTRVPAHACLCSRPLVRVR